MRPAFSIDDGLDILRGDYVALTAYDANGNWQELPFVNAPAIYVDPVRRTVQGYWVAIPGYTLSLRLLGPAGEVKRTESLLYSQSDGSFGGWASASIEPGDRIEVTDPSGVLTETMTVQPLTARFDAESSHITGASTGGRLVALPWQQGCAYYGPATHRADVCQEAEASPGAYGLTFPGFAARAGDYAVVSLRGPDGHYTLLHSPTFQVRWSQMESYPYLTVRTKSPNATVQASATHGGKTEPLDCQFGTSGYANCTLPNATERLQPGDVIHVTTSDGDQLALDLPDFTASGTNTPPSIFGNAPDGGEVSTEMYEVVRVLDGGPYGAPFNGPYLSSTSRVRVNVRPDANNTYRAPFAAQWAPATSSASLCWPAHPGSPCAGTGALYCTPAGHQVYMETQPPYSIAADTFEDDDVSTNASTYAGPQHRTFDWEGDTDWVRFEVTPAAIASGSSYRIETTGLASGAIQDVALFGVDGQTLIRAWHVESKYGLPGFSVWTPPGPGIYYLRVQRPASLGSVYCGDVYDLRVEEVQGTSFLPLLLH